MIVVSPYVLHRHRLLWRDPELFDPSRFLPGAAQPVERYAYLPFGVGPRVCIGAALAVQEATLVVATLMKHFDLDLVAGQSVWPVIDFTMKPRGGLRMRARRRRSTAKVVAAEWHWPFALAASRRPWIRSVRGRRGSPENALSDSPRAMPGLPDQQLGRRLEFYTP